MQTYNYRCGHCGKEWFYQEKKRPLTNEYVEWVNSFICTDCGSIAFAFPVREEVIK